MSVKKLDLNNLNYSIYLIQTLLRLVGHISDVFTPFATHINEYISLRLTLHVLRLIASISSRARVKLLLKLYSIYITE